jgi:hypothetical protein
MTIYESLTWKDTSLLEVTCTDRGLLKVIFYYLKRKFTAEGLGDGIKNQDISEISGTPQSSTSGPNINCEHVLYFLFMEHGLKSHD